MQTIPGIDEEPTSDLQTVGGINDEPEDLRTVGAIDEEDLATVGAIDEDPEKPESDTETIGQIKDDSDEEGKGPPSAVETAQDQTDTAVSQAYTAISGTAIE